MSDTERAEGIRDRLTTRGEDALGKLAQDLLENPLINGALARAFDAREKAAQAQEVAMGALNLPSAGDIERLTRRLRSVSQRIEGLEDGVDRVERTLSQLQSRDGLDQRLGAIEEQLAAISRQLSELGEQLPGAPAPVSRAQERLDVDQSAGAGGNAGATSGARPQSRQGGARRAAGRRSSTPSTRSQPS